MKRLLIVLFLLISICSLAQSYRTGKVKVNNGNGQIMIVDYSVGIGVEYMDEALIKEMTKLLMPDVLKNIPDVKGFKPVLFSFIGFDRDIWYKDTGKKVENDVHLISAMCWYYYKNNVDRKDYTKLFYVKDKKIVPLNGKVKYFK